MDILISGGSGFLGSAFSDWMQHHAKPPINITWLTRNTSQPHPDYVSMMSYDDLQMTQQDFDIIINLAGAGIADKRWSDERKQQLYDSRLKPTQAIIDYITRVSTKPKLLISGSAIGWYGAQGSVPLDETSPHAGNYDDDFAHQLCERWEKEASDAQSLGVEVVLVRTGIVIHPQGGMLDRLITPFKMGVGGKLGDGRQIMSWISREDWIRAVAFIIEQHLSPKHTSYGEVVPEHDNAYAETHLENSSKNHAETKSQRKNVTVYNLTSPNPVSNATFTKALGDWLNRPTFMTLPRFVLTLIFGDMSTLLVDGQKVLPKALLDAGFEFNHANLKQAL